MTDVDDEKLRAVFRAAAADAPPPGFDHDAVVTASRRVTVRRRSAVTAGAVALLVLAGVGTAVSLPGGGGGDAASTVAAPMRAPEAASEPAPEVAPDALREAQPPPAAAEPAPQAAEAPPGAAEDRAAPPEEGPGEDLGSIEQPAPPPAVQPYGQVPLGPGTGECADRHDPALRALVEEVLPEVRGAPEGATTMECRPGGERGVNVEIHDGESVGLLSVRYLPPGTAVEIPPDAAAAPTASEGTVIVSSHATEPGEPAPFEDRLDDAAAYLAPRL
ncbi:hypothetical protein [Pseudonocardia nigra]|uniref:hypothetical protein n=1 Tax=Pseudonocardia nigra TaxID=1921578 RepID=UPI001C5F5CB2|nr:hypothetical protein [Pseudonocardia nigra]